MTFVTFPNVYHKKNVSYRTMLYFNSPKYNILFIVFVITLLLVDVGQFFLAGTRSIPLLFCLYCALLCGTLHYPTMVIIALLQCLESFCFYNFFSLTFIYLIPITALALFFKKYLYPSRAHIVTLALVGVFIQIYAIEGYFLHIQQPNYYYTIIRIAAILFITISFSLIIKIWGVQDNRA
jgi:hypothetical protein